MAETTKLEIEPTPEAGDAAPSPAPAPVVAAPAATMPVKEVPVLTGFQLVGSLVGLSDEVCAKLPVEWPATKVAVGLALKNAGCTDIPALMPAIEAFREAPAAPSPAPAATTPTAPSSPMVADSTGPNPTQIGAFASQIGLGGDMSSLMTAFMMSNMAGANMDLGGLIPVTPQIVAAYSPKRKDIAYWFMGMVEQRFNGDPMIAINPDGSVNPTITMMHIQDREEGRKQPKSNTYRDEEGKGYKLINVGVDAQSIYDADPCVPGEALTRTGIGEGNVKWAKVREEVRQAIYLASTQTGEMSAADERKLGWLRDHLDENTTVSDLSGEFPEAVNAYYEAKRMGSLPTLKIQLTSRGVRRPEIMPRRRRMGVDDSRVPEEEVPSGRADSGFRR